MGTNYFTRVTSLICSFARSSSLINKTSCENRTYRGFLLLAFVVLFSLSARAQDNRDQVCEAGKFPQFPPDGGQFSCVTCPGNTISDGTTRQCSVCKSGTGPNLNHTACLVNG